MASFKFFENGKVEITITHGKRFDGKPRRYYKTVNFTSNKQLEQEAALFLADIIRGNVAISSNSTIEDIYTYYMKHTGGDIKKSTSHRYITLYERQIMPYLGNKKISKITRTDIREWVKHIRLYGNAKTHGELAPKTVKNALSFLSTLFNYAIYELEIVEKNPCERIKVPKSDEEKAKRALYTEDEVKNMLQLLADELKKPEDITHATIIFLVLFTGMRSGEVMGLKWDHIDFEKKQISIEEERIYLPKYGIVTDTPKTEGSIRTISISPFLVNLLKNLKNFQLGCKELFPGDYQDSGYVVATIKGTPQHPRNTYSWFMRFQKKNGLRHTTVHDLRHSHAAMLSRIDVKIIDISKRLGHANTRITQEVYEYLFKDIDSNVSEKLDDYYRDVLR